VADAGRLAGAIKKLVFEEKKLRCASCSTPSSAIPTG
jgi:hypothetical protein